MNRRSRGRCRLCGSREFEVFVDIPRAPAHVGVLWPSRNAARNCPRGRIALAFCTRCGFIGNVAFDPGLVDYTLRYDNALHFSPFFRDYEQRLAERLVGLYRVHGKEILEIGCGNGRFLALLCRLGGNRGTGFDPSYDPDGADPGGNGRVAVIRDHYSERHAGRTGDLVCCRHVLEHVPDPRRFLGLVRGALRGRPGALVYLEVPNALSMLRDRAVWDVIYEHCDYFTPGCLRRLMGTAGFEVLALRETYGGQFIGVEATPSEAAGGPDTDGATATARLRGEVAAFAHHLRGKREAWQRRLADLRNRGARVVVWGGGAKAVSFLNLLDLDDAVGGVVDLNPAKQRSHIAGSGHRVVAPEFLKEYRPDTVIVMNPVYRREIEAELGVLGLSPAVLTA